MPSTMRDVGITIPAKQRRRLDWALRLAAVGLWSMTTAAQVVPGLVGSLKPVVIPRQPDLDLYVRDPAVLLVLGKALFWDVQVGSDNRTACGTCHFHAGADHRIQNQLASPPDATHTVPLNHVLTPADFPFRILADPLNRNSAVVRDTHAVAASAGVPLRQFVAVSRTGGADTAVDPSGLAAPAVGGLKVRQATTRNAPSVINAVFNVLNFWDGRASNVFTGRTPFGESDTGLNLLVDAGGSLEPMRVRMENASLSSVAVAPPVNAIEMSFDGRSLPAVGARLLPLVPLVQQVVAADDSVLGPFAGAATGLRASFSYAKLVRAAFVPSLWQSPLVVTDSGQIVPGARVPRNNGREFTQMEYNFPLFWALALQAYQSSLVADDSRFDQFADGNRAALSQSEQRGLAAFQGGTTQCPICHRGPELTTASFTSVARQHFDRTRPEFFGFVRTGDTPVSDDIGAGNVDTFGQPFFPAAPRAVTRGLFKIPGLRNVELTGPYFHSGSMATLEQVLEFYARGGGSTGGENLHPIITGVAVKAQERVDLLAFLLSLTDERVRFERAPFDHPSICVPHGHPEREPGVLVPHEGLPGAPIAADTMVLVPAVGAGGADVPLQTFDELLRGIGNDGSRAHTMTLPCTTTTPARTGR
jgi:cytochrome c peroxidase